MASHIKGYGLTLGNIPLTSEQQFLMSYLNSGYPLGTQSLLGTLSGLTDTDVAVLYQGFIASLAALGAVALATVTRGLLDARRAALGGLRGDGGQPHLPVRAAGQHQGDRPARDAVRRRGSGTRGDRAGPALRAGQC